MIGWKWHLLLVVLLHEEGGPGAVAGVQPDHGRSHPEKYDSFKKQKMNYASEIAHIPAFGVACAGRPPRAAAAAALTLAPAAAPLACAGAAAAAAAPLVALAFALAAPEAGEAAPLLRPAANWADMFRSLKEEEKPKPPIWTLTQPSRRKALIRGAIS